MPYYNFPDDVKLGRAAEQEALARLRAHFPGLTDLQHCATNAYDFRGLLAGRPLTFEVKWDLRAAHTGNVAVEIATRGQPSGLAVTRADYFVYRLGERDWHLFETAVLRQRLLIEHAYDRAVTGGDPGSDTRLLLIRVSKFCAWGVRLG
jgi:hypothetical protein